MIKKIVLIASLAIYSFGAGQPPALVNTTKVTQGIVNPLEEFIGTLNFSKTSQMSSATSGLVVSVNFEAGDSLKKGDVLIEVDSRTLDTQINSATANVEIAQINVQNTMKDFNRYKDLLEKKSISQKIFDDSYFKYNTAKQNLSIAKAKLSELIIAKEYKTIKAPYDGVVVEKNIEVSEWVDSGKTVATLVATNEIDLIFNLPTSYIYKLDKNDSYDINIKDKIISSKLYASIAKGDIRTRTFPVKFKAKVNNDFLYNGMEVKINLPRSKKQNSLMVPRDAVIKRFGQNVIFLDVDSVATMMPVEILGYTKENVAVFAKGLKKDDSVVVKGNERIFPKQAIKSLDK